MSNIEPIHAIPHAQFRELLNTLPPDTHPDVLRNRCASDPLLFAEFFFPHHCRRPFSRFHLDLLKSHLGPEGQDIDARVGRRRAIAAPRGSAKTTLCSLILLLHDILYYHERYVVIVSATLKQATRRLRNLRAETEANPLLREVYAAELARRGEVRSQSINLNNVQVDAFGSGAEIRGLSSGPWRPTLILLDDVEDSEAVESAAQREKLADWFHEVIENLGDTYTNLVVIGTLLHPESLLAGILNRPDFDAHRYRSIEAFSPREDLWAEWRRRFVDLSDPHRVATARRYFTQHRAAMVEGTRVLWEDKESYYDLMVQLVTHGRRAFYQEKQNEPLAGALALFDPARIRRFRREGPSLILAESRAGLFPSPEPAPAFSQPCTSTPSTKSTKSTSSIAPGAFPASAPRRLPLDTLRVVGFLDPALGRGAGERSRAARGDFAALAVVAASGDGAFFLLDLWVRRATPLEQIRAAFDLHEHWRLERLGVEGNCFQELLRHPLEDERARRRDEGRPGDLAVEMVTHRRNKIERIAALEPLLANGWLAISDSVPEEFWRELQSFPGGDHDDALDAVEGAIDLARRMAGAGRGVGRAASGLARPPRGLGEF